MKKFLFLSIFLIAGMWMGQLFAQLTLSPDHSIQNIAACPGEEIEYTIGGLPNGCVPDIELVSGATDKFEIVPPNKFKVIWQDVQQTALVKVKPPVNSSCTAVTDFNIPILSVASQVPTIFGCKPNLLIGRSESFDMTAELFYNTRGQQDPLEADEYDWQISSGGTGWSMTTINQSGKIKKVAQIVSDNQNDATIRVRAKSRCGKWSEWASCNMVRTVAKPCPLTGAPAYIVCKDEEAIGLKAFKPDGVTGYTFEWSSMAPHDCTECLKRQLFQPPISIGGSKTSQFFSKTDLSVFVKPLKRLVLEGFCISPRFQSGADAKTNIPYSSDGTPIAEQFLIKRN